MSMSMTGNKAIGIFDSGVGGLTVLREVMRALPHEDVIYLGDTARFPYGIKSRETVTRYSLEAASYLMSRGIKILVVACNTSSSLALGALRRRLPIPVVGVIEPGARMAVRSTRKKRIGIIGTEATVRSGVYQKAIETQGNGIKVFHRACPLFVPLAEEGRTRDRIAMLAAREYLAGMKRKRIDTLVLGCTHYPLLKGAIRRALGNGVAVVDSAEEVAKETIRVMTEKGILREDRPSPVCTFLVTDDPSRFKKLVSLFLRRPVVRVRRVSL